MSHLDSKRPVVIVSACMRPDGFPDFAITEVAVTQEEYENGVHYNLAEQSLAQRGYDEPYVHFEERESPPFLHRAVKDYLGRTLNGTASHAVR